MRRKAGVSAGHARHAVTVWLALLGLFVQLSAASACMVGARGEAVGQAPFPICHVSSDAGDKDQPSGGHQAPSSPGTCSFCSLHCHAAIALAPTVGVPSPVLVPRAIAEEAPPLVPLTPRCYAGVSPRGPPRA